MQVTVTSAEITSRNPSVLNKDRSRVTGKDTSPWMSSRRGTPSPGQR